MATSLGTWAGARAVLRGFGRLLRERRLQKLALAPVALTLVAYALAAALALWKVDDLVAWIWAPPDGWLRALWWVVVVLALLVFGAILVLVFVSVAGAIGGPFYERIAKVVLDEQAIAQRGLGFTHSLVTELTWTACFAVPVATLGLMGLIPVAGPLFAATSALLAALGLAGAAAGPALVATGGGLRARLRLYRRRPGFMFGAALVLLATVLVPVVGLLVVPAAVVGLTEALAREGALTTAS